MECEYFIDVQTNNPIWVDFELYNTQNKEIVKFSNKNHDVIIYKDGGCEDERVIRDYDSYRIIMLKHGIIFYFKHDFFKRLYDLAHEGGFYPKINAMIEKIYPKINITDINNLRCIVDICELICLNIDSSDIDEIVTLAFSSRLTKRSAN